MPLGIAVEKGQALDRRARFAAEFAAGKEFDRLVAQIDHFQIIGVGIDQGQGQSQRLLGHRNPRVELLLAVRDQVIGRTLTGKKSQTRPEIDVPDRTVGLARAVGHSDLARCRIILTTFVLERPVQDLEGEIVARLEGDGDATESDRLLVAASVGEKREDAVRGDRGNLGFLPEFAQIMPGIAALAIRLGHHLPGKKTIVTTRPDIPPATIHALVGLILTHIQLGQRPSRSEWEEGQRSGNQPAPKGGSHGK